VKPLCSKCQKQPRRPGQRYCVACHAAWMRANRPTYAELPREAKRKSVARSIANVAQRRGKLKRKPCERCGGRAQKHHDDYSKPLEVRWLCRRHHLEFHQEAA